MMTADHPTATVHAQAVNGNNIMRLEIPSGLRPGDTFLVTPPQGHVFTVIVPQGGLPGAWIEVVVPDETVQAVEVNADGDTDDAEFRVKKSTAGAAVAGGLVGLLCLGPLGAVIGAAGAAYATTRREGKVGEMARDIGIKTYYGVAKIKNDAMARWRTSGQTQQQRTGPGTGTGTPSFTNVAPDVVTPAATVKSTTSK
jgi:hypothetical protein